MASFLYFAYGSNMTACWLKKSCVTAKAEAAGLARAYRLSFSKLSKDGSGKADIQPDDDATVHGVVYAIDLDERPRLDRNEGGYRRVDNFNVTLGDGTDLATSTYLAIDPHQALTPYDWYARLIIKGAESHGLPADYIEQLKSFAPMADKDATRIAKAMKCLEPPNQAT